ncbi:hypothetical protein HMPREF9264_0720 [Lactobacillus delbrueckii subsp. bulgaricus PB2003/044-T3-4]|nr:hypothetical protein HMPREF9264_0720 [Lactobacillus delbrueckii subsp. bulgaricus PB2003/044-T3-4]
MGSPPLAWGILEKNPKNACIYGITPTCVGNTLKRSFLTSLLLDHPHLRGEYKEAKGGY